MVSESFYQLSMCAEDPEELRLAADAFERRLRDMLPRIVSPADFEGWFDATVGRPPCCPMVLTGMLLLQSRYGLPDDEVVARARRDRAFRYALHLDGREQPPAVSTFRRHRSRLRERLGDDFLHRRVLALAQSEGLVDDVELQAQDSTNTECRGAIIDTFNLIAAGIGRVVRTVARVVGCAPESLATRWSMSRYLARSIKGQAAIDWSSEKARNALLTEEIRDAEQLPELVAALGLQLPPEVDEALELLQTVAHQDVERLEDGTYRIARGTCKGRVVSITDPEARHGRKSRSRTITGFKTHVQGTICSQFVTGIAITDAGVHDAQPSPKLIEQSAEVGLKPQEVVADAAYGTGANLRACASQDVAMCTKLPSSSHDGFTKRDFDIDLEAMTATCPRGHTTGEYSLVKVGGGSDERVPSFKFPRTACQHCPLASRCGSAPRKGQPRRLKLSAYEEELQRAKAFNASPRAGEVLRRRSAVERLISHLVRMGMRHARFFGMHLVQYQAFLTAAAYNLQRVFTLTRSAAAP